MAQLSARSFVRLRFLLSIVAGAGLAIAIVPLVGLAAGVLSGWGVFALVNVIWVLFLAWPMDAVATKSHATIEAPGRRAARVIIIIGSLMSLGAVLVVVTQAKQAAAGQDYVLAGIAVASVAASWMLIQIEYTLRYAQMYYGERGRGISFNQEEDPEYTDFIYFAFGLGMTYQVADTNVSSNQIRRVVVGHTLLGYLFGAVILATIINLVTGLG